MLLQRPKTQPKPKVEPFLSWLFTAHYADGHVVRQSQEDKCFTRPDGTGSAFTDVLAYSKAPLVAFGLGHINGKESAMVDLKTGAFRINGTPFHAHNQLFEPEKYPLKLIYFRETRAEQDVRGIVHDDLSTEQKNIGPARHYVNRYFIGWETTVNGKNKQVTIAVG